MDADKLAELKRLLAEVNQKPCAVVSEFPNGDGLACTYIGDDCIAWRQDWNDARLAAALRNHAAELIADAERMEYIVEHGTSVGGGNGFELKVWIPHDSECIRGAITQAIGAKT